MDAKWINIINAILEKYGIQKIDEMKAITPVRTGFLKASYIKNVVAGTLSIKNLAPYAGFVDRGTRYQEAQNFTAPLYEGLNALEQELATAISELIVADVKGKIETEITVKV